MPTCNTCVRDVRDPYRRIINGKIIEGCISSSHDGLLTGESLRWHMRPLAVAFRKSNKTTVREDRP